MKTENLKCVRCFHDLEVEEVIDFDDEIGNVTNLFCPYCGARYEVTEQKEEGKKKYDFYKDGEDIDSRYDKADPMNGHCLNCGHQIHVSNNFMLSDYDDTITDDDDDKMNFIMTECPNCGCSEVRWDSSENEHKIFPYWKEENEDGQEV